MRIKKIASFAITVTLFMCSLMAHAQNACIALLQHGIYASHVTQTSSQSYQEFRSNFCSWYSQYRESHSGGSASVSIPIVDIPIGVSGSLTYGEADSLRKAICTNTASMSSNDQAFLDASHYIDPAGASAFDACIRAESGGLKVEANINDNETLAVIGVAYQAPLGAGPATVTAVNVKNWTCSKPAGSGTVLTDLVGKTGQLQYQQVGLACQRTVLGKPALIGGQQVVADDAMISISTTAGTFTQFFRPKIYADPIADTAKVLASYPKGTILPFAGAKNQIPKGWHICDGHDGTVDLTNRIPYGAVADSEIGKFDGKSSHQHSFSGRTTVPSVQDGNVHVVQDDHSPATLTGLYHQHDYSGQTSTESNLPPVTKVYFIQKIS